MMKKAIALVLALMLLASMTACGGSRPEETTGPQNVGPAIQATEQQTEPAETEPVEAFNPETWGVEDSISVRNENPYESYYIHFPAFRGRSAGCGKFSEQLDGTMAFISGQYDDSPEISHISEILTAYQDQFVDSMESYYRSRLGKVELTAEPEGSVTIAGYEMYKFTGVIDLELDEKPYQFQFVAYATTLRSNGAYAYWMVYDYSADQVNGDIIAEYAYNMAQTFREDS